MKKKKIRSDVFKEVVMKESEPMTQKSFELMKELDEFQKKLRDKFDDEDEIVSSYLSALCGILHSLMINLSKRQVIFVFLSILGKFDDEEFRDYLKKKSD